MVDVDGLIEEDDIVKLLSRPPIDGAHMHQQRVDTPL
jgi:hypothetical protein